MSQSIQFAEQAVAGAVLIDARCLPAVRPIVKASDFASFPCAAIFRAACRLADAGKVVDPVTIQASAAAHGDNLPADFLIQLAEITPTAANAEQYAQLVHDNSIRRAVAALGAHISDAAQDKARPIPDLLGEITAEMQRIETGATQSVVNSETAACEFLDYRDRLVETGGAAVSTGFRKLDMLLGGGMVKEGLYILAARPGVGKTTLGLKIADRVAAERPVLFVSLEMSREQLTARRVADRTGLPIGKVLLGHLSDDEETRICTALSQIAQTRLALNAAAGATVADIAAMARAVPDLGLVVIDYLGLIETADRRQGIYERITANSNALKRLARSLGVPILCLSQLNRASEQRQDKRPTMADLRDSGAIEQDADGVLLLHRPSVYFPASQRPSAAETELLELDVVKNRHGRTGNVNLDFYGINGRIAE